MTQAKGVIVAGLLSAGAVAAGIVALGRIGMHIDISISDIPEAIARMRAEMAQLIRDVADDEQPQVARRLQQIAAVFEANVAAEDAWSGA